MQSLLAAVVTCGAMAGCTVLRADPHDSGEHPAGWTDPKSPQFHATWLRANGDGIAECAKCHGADFQGGAVGVGCQTQGCHQKAPDFCGTCHGGPAGPRPATGAHQKHANYCAECHTVPTTVDAPGHIGPTATLTFSGMALANKATPQWTAGTKACSGAYCHAGSTPTWATPPAGDTPCDTCHGAPPDSHVLWARVASPSNCLACHPLPAAGHHIDGKVDVLPDIACNTCHGTGAFGVPAPALDGSTDRSAPGVGAHQAHLDPNLAKRIGHVVPCTGCHVIPASVTAPDHLGTTSPARVTLASFGTFDPKTGSCVVSCHWDRVPGPVWNDATGAPAACDACHGFPPVVARNGMAHTASESTLSACVLCHVYTPTTHINGTVDLVQ